jgi:hypothetical protein
MQLVTNSAQNACLESWHRPELHLPNVARNISLFR